MKFEEALKALWKEKSIKRRHMVDSFNKNSVLALSMTPQCFLADDWEIVENGKTFPEVFNFFIAGERIKRKKWPESIYITKENGLIPMEDLLAKDWEVADEC